MPKPLHRLPNGIHIMLERVVTIIPYQGVSVNGAPSLPCAHVVIIGDGLPTTSVGCSTFAEAKSFADDLAALVNKAREG